MCTANNYKGSDFDELHAAVRRGDIIGVEGNPGRSKSGELSI
jgi:lysyl-tRNA synthetase class 2